MSWINPRYERLWACGFVHPPTGRTYGLEMPQVNVEAMAAALAAFARDAGIDAAHRPGVAAR